MLREQISYSRQSLIARNQRCLSLYNQVKLAYFELRDIDENRDVQV